MAYINGKEVLFSPMISTTIVNADSPLPIEISTEAEMTALLETAEVGAVYKYVGETTELYENGAIYIVTEEVSE